MNKITIVLMVIFYLSGCAIVPKGQAIRTAADENQFEGLNKNSKFSVSLPSTHSGPFRSIDQLNFKIEGGPNEGKNASAIIGKSRSTGTWEVLVIMINENGKWLKLSKLN